MNNFEKSFSVISKFITLEINFWTACLALILLVAGLILFTAVIFSLYIIKNSYETKAKILGYIARPIEKIRDGECIIEYDYKLVYEYTNKHSQLCTEVGSDWSDTHCQYFTGCIVPVKILSSKNYDDIYLNISNTIRIFLFLGILLILMSALVVYSHIKSLAFFLLIFVLSLLIITGGVTFMYFHQKHSNSKDQKPKSKVFSFDEIKPLEEFPESE